jgi:hypothetical protein
MRHPFVFNWFFYVRTKQLITTPIQSVCIFNFKTVSENYNVKINAFKNPDLCMEVGLESQWSFVPSSDILYSVLLKSIYICVSLFAVLFISNLFAFPKKEKALRGNLYHPYYGIGNIWLFFKKRVLIVTQFGFLVENNALSRVLLRYLETYIFKLC